MALTEQQQEQAARAYRDAIYGKPIEDQAWQSCKAYWMRDLRSFQAALGIYDLRIVHEPIRPAPSS